jgi:hypothetical protein
VRTPEVRAQAAAVDAAKEEITERDPMALNRMLKELLEARNGFDRPLAMVPTEVAETKV